MIRRVLSALAFACISFAAAGAAPQPGLWWNPAESGRGFAIDSQGSLMVVTVFAYDASGRMQWYYADGSLSADGTLWSGALLKIDHGQPLGGGYRAPTVVGNDGQVVIKFTSRTTGQITLGGVTTPIQRQNFGAGDPPQALLGDWAMVYSIGSTNWGDRYALRRILSATTNGNGVVSDNAGLVGAEYQTTGSLAGQVVMAHFTSTGTVLDRYLWTLQLEEGRGSYVGASGTLYGMNAYKTATGGGILKAAEVVADAEARGGAQARTKGVPIAEIEAHDPALGLALREMWEKLRAR